MNISVIIPTYNGAHKIQRVLQAVADQTLQPNEVIVVVDGSTDGTVEILAHQTIVPNLRVIERENGGRAVVRNTGAKEAGGELLVFLDDDMAPAAECLQEHAGHHQVIQGSILTGAQVDPLNIDQSDIQQYKAHLSDKWLMPLQAKENRPLQKNEIFLTAANFSISKHIFFELGGFDEQLKDAEDFDLAIRAYKKNIPLYYKHAAFAWHYDEITAASYIRRLRQYRKAHRHLKVTKQELFSDIPQLSVEQPKGLKNQLFLLFAQDHWIRWMDQSGWKRIIPQSLRYRMYDLIVTANGVYFPEKVPL